MTGSCLELELQDIEDNPDQVHLDNVVDSDEPKVGSLVQAVVKRRGIHATTGSIKCCIAKPMVARQQLANRRHGTET